MAHLNEVSHGLSRVCLGDAQAHAAAWAEWTQDAPPPSHEAVMAKSAPILRKLRQGVHFDEACALAFEESFDGAQVIAMEPSPPDTTPPKRPPVPTHALGLAYTWLPTQPVALATLRAPSAWALLSQLDIGGVDDHPACHEHIALLRHWQQRHQARLIALTPQSVTLWAAQLPQDWAAAFDLAQSQLDYCPGLLAQKGLGSLRELASTLRDDGLWHFRWSAPVASAELSQGQTEA